MSDDSDYDSGPEIYREQANERELDAMHDELELWKSRALAAEARVKELRHLAFEAVIAFDRGGDSDEGAGWVEGSVRRL